MFQHIHQTFDLWWIVCVHKHQISLHVTIFPLFVTISYVRFNYYSIKCIIIFVTVTYSTFKCIIQPWLNMYIKLCKNIMYFSNYFSFLQTYRWTYEQDLQIDKWQTFNQMCIPIFLIISYALFGFLQYYVWFFIY